MRLLLLLLVGCVHAQPAPDLLQSQLRAIQRTEATLEPTADDPTPAHTRHHRCEMLLHQVASYQVELVEALEAAGIEAFTDLPEGWADPLDVAAVKDARVEACRDTYAKMKAAD